MWYYFLLKNAEDKSCEPIHIYSENLGMTQQVLSCAGYRIAGCAPVIYEGESTYG